MPIQPLTQPSRRRFLVLAAGTVAVALGLSMRRARAADLPHLAESDPQAKALGYREDTRMVVAASYPNHKPGEECAKCNFYKGAPGAKWGPCQIFPGKDVHFQGWCSAFTPKA